MNSTISSQLTLAVIDDDPLIHKALEFVCKNNTNESWKVISFFSAQDVEKITPYNCAIVDMHLQSESQTELLDPSGIKIIKQLKLVNPNIPIVAMSGLADNLTMETAIQAGADRFFKKPIRPEYLLKLLEQYASFTQLNTTAEQVLFLGQSPVSQNILKQISQLKGQMGPILVEGETGTGKEVVCELLYKQERPSAHALSRPSSRPLIKVHLASLPETIFESEIFGYNKGAFTGAQQSRQGLIEMAQNGDLFFDEIEALSANMQVKLLRFLENGEYRKLGSNEVLKSNCRVILASNKSLKNLVKDGLFREDLYYRISSQRIELPPLRARQNDILLLAEYFLNEPHSTLENKSLNPEAQGLLLQYPWPGNIRELKRICEQLRLKSPLPFIRKQDLEIWLTGQSPSLDQDSKPASDMFTSNLPINSTLEDKLTEYEVWLIKLALKRHSEVDSAALSLGISRSNLYKKMKDYNL
jgi:DNA-binding NtrC family response regulator